MATTSAPVDEVQTMVADYEEISPSELPPFDDWVAGETRRKLTAANRDRKESLEFTYLWYHVSVSPAGDGTVTP